MRTDPNLKRLAERELGRAEKIRSLIKIAVVLSLAADSWQPVCAQSQPAGRKFAFLVGVKKYSHGKLRDLEFAEADVQQLAGVLRVRGFQDVLVLSGGLGAGDPSRGASARNILERLQTF